MQQKFDVIVVGSGATGGWVAKELGEAGLKVVVLEAGPRVDPAVFGFANHQSAPREWERTRRLLSSTRSASLMM